MERNKNKVSSNRKLIAIIPARGGSKGVPKKNIKNLSGKPLITWSIQVALKSDIFEKIVVTSDSSEILEIARSHQGISIRNRPENLAKDTTLQYDVIQDVLVNCKNSQELDVMLLQPTCPFRYVSDLHLSYKKYIETACNTLISVENISNYNTPTQYTGTLELLNPEIESGAGTLRQNFNNLWWRNGSIYIFNSDNFVKKNKLIRTPISGYEMPWWRSINIDTHQDFEKATDCLKLPKIIELKRHLFS